MVGERHLSGKLFMCVFISYQNFKKIKNQAKCVSHHSVRDSNRHTAAAKVTADTLDHCRLLATDTTP